MIAVSIAGKSLRSASVSQEIRSVREFVWCVGLAASFLLCHPSAAADAAAAPSAQPANAPVTPAQRVQDAPKGSLKNPYSPSQQDILSQGHDLFQSYSCSGCHGGTGGGGMCPPVNGEVWFYGLEDDTLFRLITLGSLGMDKAGFSHLGGPGLQMPPFGEIIKSDDEVWKILTWIRSVYKGDPKKKFW
jgi:mono/diheme cytochrome c family protein